MPSMPLIRRKRKEDRKARVCLINALIPLWPDNKRKQWQKPTDKNFADRILPYLVGIQQKLLVHHSVQSTTRHGHEREPTQSSQGKPW